MLITKFSKDAKRGIAVGTNSLTDEKIAAGAVTLAGGLLMAGIGGLLKINRKPKKKGSARAEKGEKNKKPPIWLAAVPFVFNALVGNFKKNFVDNVAKRAEKLHAQFEAEGDSVEVIDAIHISSEREVYDHI